MSDHTPVDPAKLRRQQRLEEQLKANLKRRKAQARARVDGNPGPPPDPAAADESGAGAPDGEDPPEGGRPDALG